MRCEIASEFQNVIRARGYTCYACAICSNHTHMVIRKHKDAPLTIWNNFAESVRQRVRLCFSDRISVHHPVISARPYKGYLSAPAEIWRCIDYIDENPVKERLPRQNWDFVSVYNNWPQHKHGSVRP